MHDVAHSFLLVYAGLFPIVNPVGNAPIFLALTSGHAEPVRQMLARRVAVNGFVLLLASLFIGSHVLEFFGITLPVLRIGGGLAVASFGWRLLRDGVEPMETGHAVDEGGPIDAFYPLTMPLTVGPGSISVAIALGAQRPQGDDLAHTALLGGAAIAGLAAVGGTIFFCYRFADRMTRVLGANGINVMIRLSAFILLCIGIQIIWNGYEALVLHSGK